MVFFANSIFKLLEAYSKSFEVPGLSRHPLPFRLHLWMGVGGGGKVKWLNVSRIPVALSRCLELAERGVASAEELWDTITFIHANQFRSIDRRFKSWTQTSIYCTDLCRPMTTYIVIHQLSVPNSLSVAQPGIPKRGYIDIFGWKSWQA